MLELRLPQGGLLKKVLEAMRELVTDANFDCSRSGVSLQAMDSSHVALVALLLRADSFDHFRCDRSRSIGMNLNHLAKILRCAANDDILTLKADDDADTITFIFENPKQDKITDFEMKLMDIQGEHLGIPEAQYQAIIKMPSQEFARICKDLSSIGDTVVISVTKEGVKFSTTGDIGSANIVCRQNTTVDKVQEDLFDRKIESVGSVDLFYLLFCPFKEIIQPKGLLLITSMAQTGEHEHHDASRVFRISSFSYVPYNTAAMAINMPSYQASRATILF